MDLWVRVMWSILGRMNSGRIECDDERWDEAVRVFGEKNQEVGRCRIVGEW